MQKLNTTAVYVLSILGILCCCFWGIGFVLSIIAFVIATSELKKYAANPEEYSNGKAMKNARTLAIVAMVISGIVAAWTAYNAIMYSEAERLEQTIEWMEQFGAPQEAIDAMEAELDNLEE
ncbi:hypothetical protein BST97_02030 [Nonlabens spongiae]|uniref:DUF4190 domain-containing protein n=1 Tax=Nonlabens spongiae TaxID=331648 RepID=A0A1W6MH07_9FLAO|nr:CCC motif membrane protein [Nonlabens spongiae]ARN76875.1 hypothetical protein BST97_02030 [Nonlabens spongiae]